MITKYLRRIVLISLLTVLCNSPSVFSAQPDFCNVFGSVYIEKSAQAADYRVYVESSEAFSNIKVFKVDSRIYADGQGLWHFTDKKAFADFTVYFEPKKGLADFTVYFIDVESFAGCNN
jgi:hypothetical protein